jgi:hypothetical protein
VTPQFSEDAGEAMTAKSPVFTGARLLLGLPRMRLLAIAALGLVVGCGSTLGSPDGGAGGTSGSGTGSGGATCLQNGVVYPQGAQVPSGDCNSCFCSATGAVGCTLIACPPDGGACAFDATYQYGETGGFTAYEDVATLTPPAAYSYERTSRITTPPSSACTPALVCGVEDVYGPSDVMRAINHPDVQAALALPTPPIYGRDYRPVDGTIFQFLRVADGRGFLAGSACDGSTGILPGTVCVDAPAAVTGLVNLLRALDEQQLRDPTCAALR